MWHKIILIPTFFHCFSLILSTYCHLGSNNNSLHQDNLPGFFCCSFEELVIFPVQAPAVLFISDDEILQFFCSLLNSMAEWGVITCHFIHASLPCNRVPFLLLFNVSFLIFLRFGLLNCESPQESLLKGSP